ncbi:MAG: helix-turn-helix transcriptional regulator [Acidimicrobiia bacterium]|nr:helix-turn-helix transcriptional regulator [Acidimicrobiia bacterium]MYE66763.1 helix-turn-helix transcriptional regulator [Acidimicrobiia bacterium]MYJ12870.1 helix-turn-helix transcriptional regulator [Acidimicrobiia bacterium]
MSAQTGPKRYPQIIRPSELGAAIQGLRRSAGLTQAELAGRARVSRKWISEMENGKATAEIGVLCHVLEALGAHIEVVTAPAQDAVLEEIIAGLSRGNER